MRAAHSSTTSPAEGGPAGYGPPDAPIDLASAIREAELRLIAREERLRRRVASLGDRLADAARPTRAVRRALPWVAGIVVASLCVWAWRRPRPAAAAPPRRTLAGLAASMAARLARWSQAIVLAWSWLPTGWHRRVSPAALTSALGVLAPLFSALAQAWGGPGRQAPADEPRAPGPRR